MLGFFLFIALAFAAAEPVVKVLNGSYAGVHLPSFNQDIFLGIPYAQGTYVSDVMIISKAYGAQIVVAKIDFGYHSR